MKVTIRGARPTYRICPDCGEMHAVDAWPDNHRTNDEVLSAPGVISDVMPPTMSMGNGRLYDSKAAIRAHYKADGFVEVGNDPSRFRTKPKAKIDGQAIMDSVDKALARFNRGERAKGTPPA